MWVQSLGQEDPLEKKMATHSNILAWEIPWTKESGGLQSTKESQRVGYVLLTEHNKQKVRKKKISKFLQKSRLGTWTGKRLLCLPHFSHEVWIKHTGEKT